MTNSPLRLLLIQEVHRHTDIGRFAVRWLWQIGQVWMYDDVALWLSDSGLLFRASDKPG
jgi:hypothetical protein